MKRICRIRSGECTFDTVLNEAMSGATSKEQRVAIKAVGLAVHQVANVGECDGVYFEEKSDYGGRYFCQNFELPAMRQVYLNRRRDLGLEEVLPQEVTVYERGN